MTSMLAPTPPRECTSFKLRQLARVVSQHYDAHVGRSGIKTTQYALLTNLMRLGPTRLGELARVLRMDASTLTRNLRPLQAQGWVDVLDAREDGRGRGARLTDAGRAKREEARRHWRAAQDALHARVGVARVAALHALIDETLACLEEPDAPDEPDPSEAA